MTAASPTSAGNPVYRISDCTVEPLLGGISISGLASLRDDRHPANELVEADCAQGCGTKLTVRRFWATITSCDACIAKAQKTDALERAKSYWESICPVAFRDTDRTHRDWPHAQYAATKDFVGKESLLFYGPSRSGKTRLGMWILRRCLVRHGMHVAVLWPERLKSVKGLRDTLEFIEKWGKPQLLLMDDALLSGAHDERVTDALKDLIDYRMRHNRHHIITSQIGSEDYKQQADKFDNMTKADEQRVDALLKRVKETSRVIPFVDVVPAADEQAF